MERVVNSATLNCASQRHNSPFVLGVPVRNTFAFIGGCSFIPNDVGVSPTSPGNPIGLPKSANEVHFLGRGRIERTRICIAYSNAMQEAKILTMRHAK